MEKEAAGIRFQTEDDEPRMENLMHQVNVQTLKAEHQKQSRKKATGIDGITKDEYSANIDENLENLVERMRQFSYRPLPVRRMYIPKANGKLRPLGIPAYEDKLVQGVMAKLLDEVYPNYRQVIPTECAEHITVDRQLLLVRLGALQGRMRRPSGRMALPVVPLCEILRQARS